MKVLECVIPHAHGEGFAQPPDQLTTTPVTGPYENLFVSPEQLEWAEQNYQQAKDQLQATLPAFEEATRDSKFWSERDNAAVFYVRREARSDLAEVTIALGKAMLDLEFARVDWNPVGYMGSDYVNRTDALAVTVGRIGNRIIPMNTLHSKKRDGTSLLPGEIAMREDWGLTDKECDDLLVEKGFGKLIGNPNTSETMATATNPNYMMNGSATAGMNVDAVESWDEGVRFYIACLDAAAGRMLNKKGDGFKPLSLEKLPRINFHSHKPNSNSTTLQVCDAEQWRQNLLNPNSPSADRAQYKRFWERKNVLSEKFKPVIIEQ